MKERLPKAAGAGVLALLTGVGVCWLFDFNMGVAYSLTAAIFVTQLLGLYDDKDSN